MNSKDLRCARSTIVEPADADSESAVVVVWDLIPTAAGVAAEIARQVETAERAAAGVLPKALEQQRAAARERTRALQQEMIRQARGPQMRMREELAREQREMRETFRTFRRFVLLRHSVARRTQACRWSRPRATVSVRAHGRPRRRAVASRDGPHRRRNSDDDRPPARRSRGRLAVLGGRRCG